MRKNLLSKHPKKKNIKAVTELSKEIRKNIRKDRKTKRLQTLERHIQKTDGVKKALKELRESNKEWIPKLNKKWKTSSNREVINEIASKFYQDLYSDLEDHTDTPYTWKAYLTYSKPATRGHAQVGRSGFLNP
ncbi:Endonuclease-reverse transcriptase [Operophtera brumata]|uniref:Endonuclease-reverse transcriptase n=1 Tax=Operophtera brumata TaxID=104452 RepID=A0A0L7LVF1_OPEBR|nr:Endonuclease-reverse transcriptase [Operophtera brumata]